jgi:hypothetical protein
MVFWVYFSPTFNIPNPNLSKPPYGDKKKAQMLQLRMLEQLPSSNDEGPSGWSIVSPEPESDNFEETINVVMPCIRDRFFVIFFQPVPNKT